MKSLETLLSPAHTRLLNPRRGCRRRGGEHRYDVASGWGQPKGLLPCRPIVLSGGLCGRGGCVLCRGHSFSLDSFAPERLLSGTGITHPCEAVECFSLSAASTRSPPSPTPHTRVFVPDSRTVSNRMHW